MSEVNKEQVQRFATYGVATVYEASGRQGLIDLPLTSLLPGTRVAGPALPVLCGNGDNLMVHAAMERLSPGDILVLTMPEPQPVALIGELLATQAKVHGAAAILVDAAVRDTAELRELGLPIWTRYTRVRGATKKMLGTIGEPVTVGGARIAHGDIVVLDDDGAVVVQASRIEEVLAASQARVEKEDRLRAQLEAGRLSYDLHGLREVVQRLSGEK